MIKKRIAGFVAGSVFGGAVFALGRKVTGMLLSSDSGKKELADAGDKAVQAVVGKLADKISDKDIPYLNRYDNTGYLEGSGYFLTEPKKDACWYMGYSKASIIPDYIDEDLYIGGYLAFPPNKVSGILNDQLIRVIALDDLSGRGINVFAVIDCIGISNTDVREIRKLLKPLINEKNIVSVNISATHCHSGIDTQGVWGNLVDAIKKNPSAIKHKKFDELVSGRNRAFMANLHSVAATAITEAVNSMHPGKLSFATFDASDFVHDKRPPFVIDKTLTCLKFNPSDGEKSTLAVFFAAHPTCYGDKMREVSSDFPYYLCDEIEKNGFNSMFFQGAEAAVATQRGKNIPDGLSNKEGIEEYGRVLARFALGKPDSEYKECEPMLNVIVKEVFIPADNNILLLAAKLRLVNNQMTKVRMEDKSYDTYFSTEIGYAEFGKELKLALIPGEMMPEMLVGGTFTEEEESYNKENWTYPCMQKLVSGHLTPVGLCNDSIGYIVPGNDFGSVFAPLHYEEAVSAGKRAASNIAAAFARTVESAKKIRLGADYFNQGDIN